MLDLSGLPQVDAAAVQVHQALLTLPGPMFVPHEGAEVLLSWHAPRRLTGPTVGATCETARGQFALTVEAELIDALCDATLDGWRAESASALPLAWRVAVVMDGLLRGTPVGAEGLRVRLDAGPEAGGSWAIGGTVSVDGYQGSFLLAPIQCEADWIERTCRQVARVPEMPMALRFGVVSHLARLELDLGRLRQLGTGDVLLFPGQADEDIAARLHGPGGLQWEGRIRPDGTFEAVARLERSEAMTEMYDDELMDEDEDLPADPPAEDDMIDGVAELPVAIDVQFHRKLVPLADFSALTEGGFLDLGIDLNQPVRIRANESTVGTGHLVRIGDRIGVRIERWRFSRTDRSG